MILVKLDVSKIDKTQLFKGAKGTYLDLVLWETEDDKYGNDFRVVQGVTKEARLAGVKGAILGNGKLGGKSAKPQGAPVARPNPAADEDVPF